MFRDHFPWQLSKLADNGEPLDTYPARNFAHLAFPFELVMKWAWRVKEWKVNCDINLDIVLDPRTNPATQHAFTLNMKVIDGLMRPSQRIIEERRLPDNHGFGPSDIPGEEGPWATTPEVNFIAGGGTYIPGPLAVYDLNVDPAKGYGGNLVTKWDGNPSADAELFLFPVLFGSGGDPFPYPRIRIEDDLYKPAFNFDRVGAVYTMSSTFPFAGTWRHQPAFGLDDLAVDPARPDLHYYNFPVGDVTITVPGEDDIVLPFKLTAVRQVLIGIGGAETPSNRVFYTGASGSYSMEATKFFPFKNGAGEPVYDPDTGEQINDPFG